MTPCLNLTPWHRRQEQGISLAVSAKKIRIVTPTPNTVVQTQDWPAELKVVWIVPPKGPKKFAVYAWKAGDARGSPQALSGNDFYTVKIAQPGTYFIQVMSLDGVWQSPAHAIHAAQLMKKGMAELGKGGDGTSDASDRIELQYPPSNFVAAGRSESRTMHFSWAVRPDFADRQTILTIAKVGSETIHNKVAQSGHNEPQLSPGEYSWRVDIVGEPPAGEGRKFEIVDPGVSNSATARRAFIRQKIVGGVDAVVFLTDGL